MLLQQPSFVEKKLQKIKPYYYFAAYGLLLLLLCLYGLEIVRPNSVSFFINLNKLLVYTVIFFAPFLFNGDKEDSHILKFFTTSKRRKIPLFILGIILVFLGTIAITPRKIDPRNTITVLTTLGGISFILSWLIFYKKEEKAVQNHIQETIAPTPRTFIKIFYSSIILIFIFFIYISFVPSGEIRVTIPQGNESNRVVTFTNNVNNIFLHSTAGNIDYSLVTQNPYSFSVHVPRPFTSVEARVVYRPSTSDNNIFFGAKNQSGTYFFSKLAVYNQVLENLPPSWVAIREGDLVLWQRDRASDQVLHEKQKNIDEQIITIEAKYAAELFETESLLTLGEISKIQADSRNGELLRNKDKEILNIKNRLNSEIESLRKTKYDTIDDFYKDQAKNYKNIVVSGTSVDTWYTPGAALESGESFAIKNHIRGSFTLLVYVDSEMDLIVDLERQDLNRYEGKDDYTVILTKSDRTLVRKVLEDDGNITADNKMEDTSKSQLVYKHASPGLYRVEIQTNDDVATFSTIVSSPYVTFEKKLYTIDSDIYGLTLSENANTPLILFTNGSEISFVTAHTESLQDIKVNSQVMHLDKTNEIKKVSNLSGITKITLPKRDVKIISDGVLSFSLTSPLFNYWHYSEELLQTPEAMSSIDYIFAYYPRPKIRNDGWYEASATLYAPGIAFTNNIADFQLNFDRLSLDSRSVKVKEIDLTFRKEPITLKNVFSKFKAKIVKIWN